MHKTNPRVDVHSECQVQTICFGHDGKQHIRLAKFCCHSFPKTNSIVGQIYCTIVIYCLLFVVFVLRSHQTLPTMPTIYIWFSSFCTVRTWLATTMPDNSSTSLPKTRMKEEPQAHIIRVMPPVFQNLLVTSYKIFGEPLQHLRMVVSTALKKYVCHIGSFPQVNHLSWHMANS